MGVRYDAILGRLRFRDVDTGGSGGTNKIPQFVVFTLDAADIIAKQVQLPSVPLAKSIIFQVDGGGDQIKTISWDFVAPDIISWSGLTLDGLLAAGRNVAVTYLEA